MYRFVTKTVFSSRLVWLSHTSVLRIIRITIYGMIISDHISDFYLPIADLALKQTEEKELAQEDGDNENIS